MAVVVAAAPAAPGESDDDDDEVLPFPDCEVKVCLQLVASDHK